MRSYLNVHMGGKDAAVHHRERRSRDQRAYMHWSHPAAHPHVVDSVTARTSARPQASLFKQFYEENRPVREMRLQDQRASVHSPHPASRAHVVASVAALTVSKAQKTL